MGQAGGSGGRSDLTKTAEVTEATLIVAYVRSTEKVKERENRPSTSPREDRGSEEEEGRTKKAENSASSLYNCLNATGIAFIQLKRSLSLYIGGGKRTREGWGWGAGLGGVGGRESRRCPPSFGSIQR